MRAETLPQSPLEFHTGQMFSKLTKAEITPNRSRRNRLRREAVIDGVGVVGAAVREGIDPVPFVEGLINLSPQMSKDVRRTFQQAAVIIVALAARN